MNRTASDSLKGYLYQFNKTLISVLESTHNAEIICEGIIEDIDIMEINKTTAIQCKYYESQKVFHLSLFNKAILLMLLHHLHNASQNIKYILFSFFPNEENDSVRKITQIEIVEILKSKNKEIKDLIEKIKKYKNGYKNFINNFHIEFGDSLDNLIGSVKRKLIENGLNKNDIEELSYPNAIQIIANKSSKKSINDRKITKFQLLEDLKRIRSTAISKWTKELKNYHSLLKARKKQLNANLRLNRRLRCFIIDEITIENFIDEIIVFIKDYVYKYNSKPYLQLPSIFCLDCSQQNFDDIRIRLSKLNIKFCDGLITDNYFDEQVFFKDPIVAGTKHNPMVEFTIRVMQIRNSNFINSHKPDDLFIISEKEYSEIEKKDINSEMIDTNKINEIKYLLNLRDTYE
ncbi:MAG: hypothetical protein EPN82_13115 [Bacteroidetes bacterium]|nr:MAG: hypothetical protein EPN82_13115 [Bacteroidota bacterium]